MDALKSLPLIHGDGTSEEHWRPRLNSSPVRRRDRQELLPTTDRWWWVAPHPDDKVLGCGALIATHAPRGGRCLIVAVTDGEASRRGIAGWDPVERRLTRVQKRLRGLMALELGSDAVLRLQLPDGRIAEHEAALTGRLREILRTVHLVVTWHRDGPCHGSRDTRLATRGIALEWPGPTPPDSDLRVRLAVIEQLRPGSYRPISSPWRCSFRVWMVC